MGMRGRGVEVFIGEKKLKALQVIMKVEYIWYCLLSGPKVASYVHVLSN